MKIIRGNNMAIEKKMVHLEDAGKKLDDILLRLVIIVALSKKGTLEQSRQMFFVIVQFFCLHMVG